MKYLHLTNRQLKKINEFCDSDFRFCNLQNSVTKDGQELVLMAEKYMSGSIRILWVTKDKFDRFSYLKVFH